MSFVLKYGNNMLKSSVELSLAISNLELFALLMGELKIVISMIAQLFLWRHQDTMKHPWNMCNNILFS